MLEDNLEDRTRKKAEMSWCLWVAALIFIHENVWLRDSITWKPTSFFHAVVVQAPRRKSYETALYMAPWSLSQRLNFSKDSAIAKDSQSLLKEQRSWGSSLMITPKFRELSFSRFYISSKVAGRESFLALEKRPQLLRCPHIMSAMSVSSLIILPLRTVCLHQHQPPLCQ